MQNQLGRLWVTLIACFFALSLTGANCGGEAPDPGIDTLLMKGFAEKEKKDCNLSLIEDVFNKICDLIAGSGCAKTQNYCADYARQIYVGNELNVFETTSNDPAWTGMGGRGKILAEAAMCSLRELSPQIGGPIQMKTPAFSLLGQEVTATQTIGYLGFDQLNPKFQGYRKVRICAPVLGCLDAVSQKFDVNLWRTGYSPEPMALGFPIHEGIGLNVYTEESEKEAKITLPGFTVATPVGPVYVEPILTYGSRASVIDSPYMNSNNYDERLFWMPDGQPIKLFDIYGVNQGLKYSTPNETILERGGWNSQLGLGNRQPLIAGNTWSPGNPVARPDWILNWARSDKERRPTIEATASARATYPEPGVPVKSYMPAFVHKIPFGIDIDFDVWVEPTLRVATAGQFMIYAAEGHQRYQPKEFRYDHDALTDFMMTSGLSTTAGFIIKAGMNLTIDVSFPWPVGDKEIIDTHPTWELPLGESLKEQAGKTAYFASNHKAMPDIQPGYGVSGYKHFETFHNKGVNPVTQAKDYVKACLDPKKPLLPQEPPKDESTKGDPGDLFNPDEVLWPCNICVGHESVQFQQAVQGTDGQWYSSLEKGLGLIFETSEYSEPDLGHWQCDSVKKVGCMDMCKMEIDPITGNMKLTVVEGPDDILLSYPGVNGGAGPIKWPLKNTCYDTL